MSDLLSAVPAASTWSQEGDVNTTSERERWEREQLSAATRELLAADAQCFLHQSLSTPCLNALAGARPSIARFSATVPPPRERRYFDTSFNIASRVG